ncbi:MULTISPECIES: NADPH-dependent F420 reductase [unclassified Rhizobium]|uniref:NADPH-dependent F420 reductase n=1 Tax=unclassified Rhizobium TaxID=2613769 RepID=UPI001C82F0BD|nr:MULTISPECIES: NAD(P)-binding domain-containing protein [unclassified Rhizobium]MBX5162943.1 NAD(P)-binding domain-containing protein [Rhizobium sp. NZLR4b]MBX5189012.1 NAD(P)-binding domain-containing protein [Rhizobium sp. NZLR3b]MBX5195371.1 NAD(P)-binding domain-containing protein [Rhizobium sp. NZLR10]MBX5207362.1 NAD(P)-binding domain-containing protein [Rhizobium sp. NZLR11]
MKTAIIGTGNMGAGLARRLAGKRELILASRNEAAAKSLAEEIGATSAPISSAVAEADILVLALPYASALEFAGTAALQGKIVVDMTNPLKPDFSGLLFGHDTSAAEEIQHRATGAKVVKAFNTIFAELFAASPKHTSTIPVFLAGDDDAVDTSAALVKDADFAVEKTGSLDAARLLEPLGMLNIRLGYGLGRGTGIAPKWAAVDG